MPIDKIDAIIKETVPESKEIVRVVAESSKPSGPGDSGEHVVIIPDNPPPMLDRPSGEPLDTNAIEIDEAEPTEPVRKP